MKCDRNNNEEESHISHRRLLTKVPWPCEYNELNDDDEDEYGEIVVCIIYLSREKQKQYQKYMKLVLEFNLSSFYKNSLFPLLVMSYTY